MEKLDPNKRIGVPFMSIPVYRTNLAVQKGVEKNLLFVTWGGIGDVICSEPTVRYAIEKFKDCRVTIATRHPELFQHLKFHDIYDLKKETPIADDYLIFQTIPVQDQTTLIPQFISHMYTHCVDFPALSALRSQLPINHREVILKPAKPGLGGGLKKFWALQNENYVVVHAGRHWQTKTFPAKWWNAVIDSIIENGMVPVLIGKHEGETQGYVDTKTEGCVDLRDQTTIEESIWLLQNSPVLVCNDSSPLHMAATGNAFIGFVASVKHPDYITHYRKGKFGWRMENFELDGMWNHSSMCPNSAEDVNLDKIGSELVASFLPEPSVFGPWCKRRIDEYRTSI